VDQAELLRILKEAQGDPALLALATVDVQYPDVSIDDRHTLRLALEAAAVPHWIEPAMLEHLVAPVQIDKTLWAQLTLLSEVQPFPARGENAMEVNGVTRVALRRRLFETDPSRFQVLSERVVDYLRHDAQPARQIERVYHYLVASPNDGADSLEQLHRTWSMMDRKDDVRALCLAIAELYEAGRLDGRALVRGRLIWARGEILARPVEMEGLTRQLAILAQAHDDGRLIADAQSLAGEAAIAAGNLDAALAAFNVCRSARTTLVADGPPSLWDLFDLAKICSQSVEVAQALGDEAAAEELFQLLRLTLDRLSGHVGRSDSTAAHDSHLAPVPPPCPSRVFISYRRTDSRQVAGRIRDRVADHVGNSNVFFDATSMQYGVDYRVQVHATLADCEVLLVVIGKEWLTTADSKGRRRLDNAADTVRLEIEAGLERKIPVVPIMVDGALLPVEADLPASLKALAFCHGISVRDDHLDFHTDLDRLILGLNLSRAVV
jgi:TIR domain